VKIFQDGNNNNNNKGIFYRNIPFFLKSKFLKTFEKKSLHLDFDFSLVAF
jgi:hypothetical protein